MTLEKRVVFTGTGTDVLRSMTPPGVFADDYCLDPKVGTLVCQARIAAPIEYFRRLGSFWLGTGGSFHAGLRFEDPGFSGVVVQLLGGQTIAGPATVAEMLGAIKERLSLTLADVARVLLVQRPTIYAWLDGSQVPREGNVRRLATMYRISEEIRETTKLRLEAAEKVSLLELLQVDVLDERACQQLIRARTSSGPARQERPKLTTSGGSTKSDAMQDAARQRSMRRFGGRRRG